MPSTVWPNNENSITFSNRQFGLFTTFCLFTLFEWCTYKKQNTICPIAKSSFTFGEKWFGLLMTFLSVIWGCVCVKAFPSTALPQSKIAKIKICKFSNFVYYLNNRPFTNKNSKSTILGNKKLFRRQKWSQYNKYDVSQNSLEKYNLASWNRRCKFRSIFVNTTTKCLQS